MKEELRVPPADFRSYYGRPVIKAPVWRDDIPAYLFTGGLAAGASMLAAGGDATGRGSLRRAGRWTALGALLASTGFLVHDLGRSERFLHMLRVIKPTSPMSVGTWILTAYGPPAGLAAVSELACLLPVRGPLGVVRRVLPGAGRAGGWTAAVVSPALASYTGVLIADTAVPAWHDAHPYLPVAFAGSALAAGAGAALLTVPTDEAGPARRAALTGAAVEMAATHAVEHRIGMAGEAYRTGEAARWLGAARALTAGGALAAVLGRRSRWLSAVSGAALLGGSLAMRFGIYRGGVASAKDPRYTVVPQRERLAARPPSHPGDEST